MRLSCLAAALALCACGPLEEDDRSYAPSAPASCPNGYESRGDTCVRVVDYDLECTTVRCIGPDDTEDYDSDYYQSYTCTWYCAEYEGQADRYVSITFDAHAGDSCWGIGNTYVTSGICD